MKRFLILPLTFLMLISTLIGCTNFGDNSDSDTENNSSNTNNDYNPPSSDTGGNTGGGGSDEPYNPPTYSYTVIHYKSDTYETEEETFYVTAGTTVTIVPKQYEFYHPDPDNTAQKELRLYGNQFLRCDPRRHHRLCRCSGGWFHKNDR